MCGENRELAEISGYWAFLMSINWRDPWLVGLMAAHILTTTTISVLSRNNVNIQFFLFLFLVLTVYFTKSINEYASSKWSTFSGQPSIENNGLFISTVFSIPILLNCMLLISTWFYNSTQAMATLQAAQIRERLHQQRILLEQYHREVAQMNAAQMNAAQTNAAQTNADQMNADQMNAAQMNVAKTNAAKRNAAKKIKANIKAAKRSAQSPTPFLYKGYYMDAINVDEAHLDADSSDEVYMDAINIDDAYVNGVNMNAANMNAADMHSAQ